MKPVRAGKPVFLVAAVFAVMAMVTSHCQAASPEIALRPRDWIARAIVTSAHLPESQQSVVAEELAARGVDLAPLDATVAVLEGRLPAIAKLLDAPLTVDNPQGDFAELAFDEFTLANVNQFRARKAIYDGKLEVGMAKLAEVDETLTADPAGLVFLKGICHYRLQQQKPALESLRRLTRTPGIPKRYEVTAQLMIEELQSLDPEKLRGIAHDMRDVERRLELGSTDEPVQEAEKDIIRRLDKLIEELEKQQQQQQQASSQQSSPSQPQNDSRIAGTDGKGEVGENRHSSREAWGNLPPKERDKVLQNIDRNFPAQYREAIEQYFREMADDNTRSSEPPSAATGGQGNPTSNE